MPSAAALIAVLAVRELVLTGREPVLGLAGLWSVERWQRTLGSLGRILETVPAGIAAVAVVGSLILALLLAFSARARTANSRADLRPSARAAGLGIVLLLATILPAVTVEPLRPWYLVLPTAGAALLFGAALNLSIDLWRRGRGALVAIAAVAGLALTLVLGATLALSPILRRYPQLERGSRLGAQFLGELERSIALASPGQSVALRLPPLRAPARPGEPSARAISILMPHSVRAWLALRRSSDGIEVVEASSEQARSPVPLDCIRIVLEAAPAKAAGAAEGSEDR